MRNASAPGTLVLLRHGESEWNKANLFTGWVDVHLSEKGRAEATRGGELLAAAGLLPDVLHTSLLRRAITTAELALAAAYGLLTALAFAVTPLGRAHDIPVSGLFRDRVEPAGRGVRWRTGRSWRSRCARVCGACVR